MKMHSPNFTDDNIAKLAELFPSCITESKDTGGKVTRAIDFNQLKQELSNNIVDGPQERYQINWPGKREALLNANAPIAKTLRPCREESVDFDTTENLFIEGDNLDALKLLQETYLGKIKMIYIDPPYNTGNDFIYKDNFAESTEEYLLESGQKDEEGNRLVTNTDSNGRFHSDWLSMMYSRLRLARNLLTYDGAIFVSIGVEEVANLKKIVDEIFGEGNLIEIFSWIKTSTPPALSIKSRKTNEYIICYEYNRNKTKYRGPKFDGGDQPLLNKGNAIRKLKFPRQAVKFTYLNNGTIHPGIYERLSTVETIDIKKNYSVEDFILEGEFKWTQEKLNLEIQNGATFVIKSEKLSIRFIRDEEGYNRPTNFIKEKIISPLINKKFSAVDTNRKASSDLQNLMEFEAFSYSKPVSLISYLANFIVGKNDLVLDFFAGSSTTAHAIMQLNSKDGGSRKFIMVQLPEVCDEKSEAFKAGYKTIAEISKERIRRAGNKIKEGEGLLPTDLDTGFRVLKVDDSNMLDVYYSPDSINQGELSLVGDNIKEDRSPEDLLFQVLLDWGVDLSLPIKKETIAGQEVFFVDGDALAACFDKKGQITDDFCKELATRKPLRVVFRDAGFKDDSAKINVEQIFKLLSPSSDLKTI